MTALEENIREYMNLKGIKHYSDLLVDIAHHLNITSSSAYDFVNKEKANFSKMLKGERPLKYEFIIPLEQIFGVSLAKLLNKDAYKLPVEKEDVPFNKGFRYYAYLNNPDKHAIEVDGLLTKSSRSVFSNTDEFEKNFLDYVVEYNATNWIRYLADKYELKIRMFNNEFESKPTGVFFYCNKSMQLARMISNMHDVKLFNKIYDPRHMMASNGFYLENTIFAEDEFAEIILDNKELFESMFEIVTYRYNYGAKGRIKHDKEYYDFDSINPVINTCLDVALRNLNKYRAQAITILKFAKKHNENVMSLYDNTMFLPIMDDCGGLRNKNEILQVVVFVKQEQIDDAEIVNLIKQIPVFMSYNH